MHIRGGDVGAAWGCGYFVYGRGHGGGCFGDTRGLDPRLRHRINQFARVTSDI